MYMPLTTTTLGRDFWFYRIGRLISALGDFSSTIALSWWTLEMTSSTTTLASILAPALAVRLVLTPIFGVFADRFNRKKLVIIGDIYRACVALGLYFFASNGIFKLEIIISIQIIEAMGCAFFNSASFGVLPLVVPKSKLPLAIQKTKILVSLGTILGGSIGGGVVTWLGIAAAFLLDAATFFAAALFSALIRIRAAEPPKNFRFHTEMLGGLRVLRDNSSLANLGFTAMLLNFFLFPTKLAFPLLAKQSYELPAWALGAIQTGMGVGSVVGALVCHLFTKRLPKARVLTIAIWVLGASIALMGLKTHFAVLCAIVFMAGVGSSLANLIISTNLALETPKTHFSRVSSIISVMCEAVGPPSLMLAGILLTNFGVSLVLVGMGIGVIAITLFNYRD